MPGVEPRAIRAGESETQTGEGREDGGCPAHATDLDGSDGATVGARVDEVPEHFTETGIEPNIIAVSSGWPTWAS